MRRIFSRYIYYSDAFASTGSLHTIWKRDCHYIQFSLRVTLRRIYYVYLHPLIFPFIGVQLEPNEIESAQYFGHHRP